MARTDLRRNARHQAFPLLFASLLLSVSLFSLAVPRALAEKPLPYAWHDCCDLQFEQKYLDANYEAYVRASLYVPAGSPLPADWEAQMAAKRLPGKEAWLKANFHDKLDRCRQDTADEKKSFLDYAPGGDLGMKAGMDPGERFYSFWYTANADPFELALSANKNTERVAPGATWLSVFRGKTLTQLQSEHEKLYAVAARACKDLGDEEIERRYRTDDDPYNLAASDFFARCVKERYPAYEEMERYGYLHSRGAQSYAEGLITCYEQLSALRREGVRYAWEAAADTGCTPNADGCCPGYHTTALAVCCKDGFDAKKNDAGVVVCDPIQRDDQIVDVTVRLDKTTLLLDGKDTVVATFTYLARTPGGAIGPYANKGVLNLYEAQAEYGNLKFKITPLATTTDASGSVKATIVLAGSAKDALSKNNSKVYVYATDTKPEKRKDAFFTTTLGNGLHIKYVGLADRSKAAWQEGGAKVRIEVEDPISELKRYTIVSTDGIRVDGQYKEEFGFKSTKENVVEIGWYAPRITEKRRLNYGKHLKDALTEAKKTAVEGTGAEDKTWDQRAEDELKKYVDARDASLEAIENGDWEKVEQLAKDGKLTIPDDLQNYDRFKKLSASYGALKLIKEGVDRYNEMSAIEQKLADFVVNPKDKKAYEGVDVLIDTVFFFEGLGGMVSENAKLPKHVKIPLQLVKGWYAAVAEMDEIAEAPMAVTMVPLFVTVEGVESGSVDTLRVEIPVEGYTMVLDSETLNPWEGEP